MSLIVRDITPPKGLRYDSSQRENTPLYSTQHVYSDRWVESLSSGLMAEEPSPTEGPGGRLE